MTVDNLEDNNDSSITQIESKITEVPSILSLASDNSEVEIEAIEIIVPDITDNTDVEVEVIVPDTASLQCLAHESSE